MIGRGGVRVVKDGQELSFALGTERVVRPELKPTAGGASAVVYRDVWPGVDLSYEYRGTALKEVTRLNGPTTQNRSHFRLTGATVRSAAGGIVFAVLFTDVLARSATSDWSTRRPKSAPTGCRGWRAVLEMLIAGVVLNDHHCNRSDSTSTRSARRSLTIAMGRAGLAAGAASAFPLRERRLRQGGHVGHRARLGRSRPH
ncbi:MAG: hypothetical protein ACRD12_19550 [Acidimicrobiales bacterium]